MGNPISTHITLTSDMEQSCNWLRRRDTRSVPGQTAERRDRLRAAARSPLAKRKAG